MTTATPLKHDFQCFPSPTPPDPPDIATSVIFARDCGSGRVTIDRRGRPRINYWPDAATRAHVLDVSNSKFEHMFIDVAERFAQGPLLQCTCLCMPGLQPTHTDTKHSTQHKTHNTQHTQQGMELALRAYMAAGAESVTLPHAFGHLTVRREQGPAAFEAMIAEARRVGIQLYDMPLMSAHQMGSCRMGGSPR